MSLLEPPTDVAWDLLPSSEEATLQRGETTASMVPLMAALMAASMATLMAVLPRAEAWRAPSRDGSTL